MNYKTIDFFCKNCKKSFKTSHLVTGDDMTPVLANTIMKCHHCNRAVILKKYSEGQLMKNQRNGNCYI